MSKEINKDRLSHILLWWRKLSDCERNTYEYKMFGSGEWYEYNKLTTKDIILIHEKFILTNQGV